MDELDDELSMPKGPLTLTKRVEVIEIDTRRFSRIITGLTKHGEDLHKRVSELEDWQVNKQITEARENERDISLYDRLSRIEKGISDGITNVQNEVANIKNFGWKIFWLVMTPVVIAAVSGIAVMVVYGTKIVANN